jgi:endogenous inhibitor of DNA gyrase (YacG/DUF329 family)
MMETRTHKCPRCKSDTVWQGNPDRPFCSERCKLIDLGAWADEQHTIPGNVDADENDVLSGDLEPGT